MNQLETLLHELRAGMQRIQGGFSSQQGSARTRSRSLTVVTRVGTRPPYQEIINRLSPTPEREEIVAVLREFDYTEASARNIAPTYLHYVLGNRPVNGNPPRK